MALDGTRFSCTACLKRYLGAYLAVYESPGATEVVREEIWVTFLR